MNAGRQQVHSYLFHGVAHLGAEQSICLQNADYRIALNFLILHDLVNLSNGKKARAISRQSTSDGSI